ncbi:helix-turn-helix domain-containing protein [Crocinitomix algicola]|uniref:helix-turn-helix domain-containing protein n=1 Tax=Crocinitomix algicola TaxID=1740263 RepID=UPI000837807F|nr:AraC family transcriptional regulator [Crocinitomix algicola]
MELQIKNMVCDRCIMAVKNILQQADVEIKSIQLGRVVTKHSITQQQIDSINEKLTAIGFEIIENKDSKLINEIKTKIIELVHYNKTNLKVNLSTHIAQKLGQEYSYLSKLFSNSEGITIEKYYILQKVERVKELLTYQELNLEEIADQLGYSSNAYLTNQFKKITGFTPSQFRKLPIDQRQKIEHL